MQTARVVGCGFLRLGNEFHGNGLGPWLRISIFEHSYISRLRKDDLV